MIWLACRYSMNSTSGELLLSTRAASIGPAKGADPKRGILAFWVGYAAAELKPLYLRLRELLLASGSTCGGIKM
jgi:hypothetical protein